MRAMRFLDLLNFADLAIVGLAVSLGTFPALSAVAVGNDMEIPSVDITGDGIPDEIRVVVKGEDHLECIDGATRKMVWRSTCYLKGWGSVNRAGHLVEPLLYDVNRDGLPDLVFEAMGCDAIVALDRKTGQAHWSLPVKKTLGSSAVHPDLYRGRDMIRIGDLLAVGITDPDLLRPEEAPVGGAIMALDPRDGSVKWRAPLPIDRKLHIHGKGDSFDGVRITGDAGASLTLRAGGARPGSSTSAGAGSVRMGVSFSSPVALMGLADTPRLLVATDRVAYAGRRTVMAVDILNGSPLWSWKIPATNDLINTGLLKHAETLLLFGWVSRPARSFPAEALLAALEFATGKPLWQARFKLPMGTMWAPESCEVTLRLGEQVVLDYVSPKDETHNSRRFVLDRVSGKIVSEGPLATAGP